MVTDSFVTCVRSSKFSTDKFDVQGISVSVVEPNFFVICVVEFFMEVILDKLVPDVLECSFREGIALTVLEEDISDLFVAAIPLRRFITDSLVVTVVNDFSDRIDNFEGILFDSSYVSSTIPTFRFVELEVAGSFAVKTDELLIGCCSDVNLRDVEVVDNLIRYGEFRKSSGEVF